MKNITSRVSKLYQKPARAVYADIERLCAVIGAANTGMGISNISQRHALTWRPCIYKSMSSACIVDPSIFPVQPITLNNIPNIPVYQIMYSATPSLAAALMLLVKYAAASTPSGFQPSVSQNLPLTYAGGVQVSPPGVTLTESRT